jgi:nitronate monooxygenase
VLFHDVTTIRHARKAAEAGADGLILICGGGGGHSGLLNPFTFVPQVRDFFDGVIVLAGAVGTGEALRAAEVLGADLCYMGTRFIATQESRAPDAYKEMVRDAASEDLIYTPALSRGIPAMLMKASLRRHGLDPNELTGAVLPEGVRMWRELWAAGQSVGVIHDIPTVHDLASRLRAQYEQARARPLRIAAEG